MASSGTLGPVVGEGKRGGDFPHQNNFQKIARAYWQTGFLNLHLVHKCVVFGVFDACMPEELTMKKDVAASAAGAVAPKKPGFSLIDEDLLKSRIYTIRGVKVMLDADLAEIYGYSTKDFNRQVKNNIEKFVQPQF